MEHPFPFLDPVRQGACTRSDEGFRFGIPQHVPIAGGLASGEVDGISAHEFSDRRRIIFLFGKMAWTDVESCDGRCPRRQISLIPQSRRFDQLYSRLTKGAR